MDKTEAKNTAAELYALCEGITETRDFAFPSWLLCVSSADLDNAVFADEERANHALDDASLFAKTMRETENYEKAREIQNGVYNLVVEFPFG